MFDENEGVGDGNGGIGGGGGGGGPEFGPPTSTTTLTGIAAVDALFQGRQWDVGALTFSFPTSVSQYTGYGQSGYPSISGFSAFSSVYANAARQVLGATGEYGSVASLINLTFSETSGGSGDLRFGNWTNYQTAYGFYPTNASDAGGDVWFNAGFMSAYGAPVKGNYTHLTMMHEVGHALGLKHGHETSGITGTAVPLQYDCLEFTVMSYRSYVGQDVNAGYQSSDGNYPQTFMMMDIRALQQMYGADFSTNSNETIYTWDSVTGTMSLNGVAQSAASSNKIFATIWDGGGIDTYDFSNYTTGGLISLNPGEHCLFSTSQQANLGGGNYARGNIYNALQFNGDLRSLIENAKGTSGADTIYGNQVANVLSGNAGADTLFGGGGNDQLIGGAGADILWGEAGADVFVLSNTTHADGDQIQDFQSGVDRLELSGDASFSMKYANGVTTIKSGSATFSVVGVVQLSDIDWIILDFFAPSGALESSGWEDPFDPLVQPLPPLDAKFADASEDREVLPWETPIHDGANGFADAWRPQRDTASDWACLV